MMKRYSLHIAILAALFMASCTTARWTVKKGRAVDRDDYKIVSTKKFLSPVGEVSPDSPQLQLQLLSRTKYQYAQKVLMQRNIQKYKLKAGFLALSLAGSAIAFYAANSSAMYGNSKQSIPLNAVGTTLAVAGFLNLKPVGGKKPTDEQRYLRKTGTVTRIDTQSVKEAGRRQADIEVTYNDRVLMQEKARNFKDGLLEVNLASPLNELTIEGTQPGEIGVHIQFQDSSYRFSYPLKSVLKPYARVRTPITALRNSPGESKGSVLAELGEGSQLQIVDASDSKWYKVLYGISENFILKKDTKLVWGSSKYSQENEVITIPRVPFGNIDVESNIPILAGRNQNAHALIITNENYGQSFSQRTYAHRDGRLAQTYLENALGYPVGQVRHLQDVDRPDDLRRALEALKSTTNDSSDVFIYLSGYGSLSKNENRYKLGFIMAGANQNSPEERSVVNFSELFKLIASVPAQQLVVLSDIDFKSGSDSTVTEQDLSLERPLLSLSSKITENRSRAALFFASQPNQSSMLYTGSSEDKKHHIFPYFFFKAIQQRKTGLGTINQFIQRNVSYTARRLHDHPQDPQFFGNINLTLSTSAQ